MSVRRFVSSVLSGLLAVVFLFLGTMPASAVAPLTTLDGPITDQSGTFGGNVGEIETAQSQFHEATGGQFYVVFIDSFEGMTAEDWSQQTAENVNLGAQDLLLAVSTSDPDYYLVAGTGLNFPANREAAMVDMMDNSLTAGLNGTTSWQAATANIIGAFQNEIVGDETTVQGTQTPPPGAVNDGGGATVTDNQPVPTVDDDTSGGLPGWARVLLWILIPLALIAAVIYGWGGYKRKRLEAKQAQDPFGLQ